MRTLIRKRRRPGLLLGVAFLSGRALCYTSLNRGSSNVYPTKQNAREEYPTSHPSAPENKEVRLPPWISRHEGKDRSVVEQQVQWLEFSMLEQGFSPIDVRDVAVTLERASKQDPTTLAGIVEFLLLMLQLEEKPSDHHVFVTKEVVMACAIHYAECATARQEGVYDVVREAIYRDRSLNWFLPAHTAEACVVDDPMTEYFDVELRKPSASIIRIEDDGLESSQKSSDGSKDDEVSRIVLGAARLKRAEIMAHTVLGNRSLTKEEASRLRGLLLSVMDDWRSLAIRAVACQYRLEGVLRETEHGVKQYVRTPELVRMAKEAMHVFAPLAQRLGMQRLKAKIEDNAFRILYRRQYRAASALYRQNGAVLKAMSRYLEGQVAQLLLNNSQLMSQLDDIQIRSRVKEPYSSWRKLVTKRFVKSSRPSLTGSSQRSITPSTSSISDLSILDINDGVALRVILQARKHSTDEPDETTRARERLLCYYVQHLLRSQWMGSSKAKDYIQFPKENGYQSLHYNSFISSQGQDWPFEVQVRSKEMHQIAEYGVAAHWDYKLSNPSVTAALPPADATEPFLDGVNLVDVSYPMIRHIGQTSYIDALENAKDELVQNKVFVFFASSAAIANEGEILSLPLGARVGDALDELERMLGSNLEILGEDPHNLKVTKNGREANSDDLVGNGDVLLISLSPSSRAISLCEEITTSSL